MRFLIDRCTGRRLAAWLLAQGHDVVEVRDQGPDPGDRRILELAAAQKRILVTIDTDFGELVYVRGFPHAGIVRLPDVRSPLRIALMEEVLARHAEELEERAIITVRGQRIRVSRFPPRS